MFFSPVVRSGSSPGSRGRCGASALRCSWHSWCLQHLRVQIWKWAFPRRSESRRQTKYGAVEAVPSSSLPTRGPSCRTRSLCAQGRRHQQVPWPLAASSLPTPPVRLPLPACGRFRGVPGSGPVPRAEAPLAPGPADGAEARSLPLSGTTLFPF